MSNFLGSDQVELVLKGVSFCSRKIKGLKEIQQRWDGFLEIFYSNYDFLIGLLLDKKGN